MAANEWMAVMNAAHKYADTPKYSDAPKYAHASAFPSWPSTVSDIDEILQYLRSLRRQDRLGVELNPV